MLQRPAADMVAAVAEAAVAVAEAAARACSPNRRGPP
jgi:hypothetical protein